MMTENQFTNALVSRLRLRKGTAHGDVWVLDLRHRNFGNQLPRFVRCPGDAGWPEMGRTTSQKKLAEEWIRTDYAPRMFQEIKLANAAPGSSQQTFAMAAEAYIVERIKQVGKEGLPKIQSRISMLEHHLVPALGHLALNTITRAMVSEHANSLKIRRFIRRGHTVVVDALNGTKKNFVRAANAVWHHTFPGIPCPYAGVRLIDHDAIRERRRAIQEGRLEELMHPTSGAMDPQELQRALLGAMHYDTTMGRRKNVAATAVPNTPHAIAIQTGLGLRISELRNLRWGHVFYEEGYVLVGGTKTGESLRVVPLQRQVVPWLKELEKRFQGSIDPRAFVIRSNGKASVTTRASTTALSARYGWALAYAGLKRPKKRTHWARATHATWGQHSKAIQLEDLQRFLGHSNAYGDSTSRYIGQLVQMMRAEHRTYIDGIPTPKQVRAALRKFAPQELPPWKERRRVFGRKKTDLAARQARARAKVTMVERYSLKRERE